MTRILITGAKGFTAGYLIKELSERKGAELYCTDILGGNGENWHKCDLTDFDSTYRLIKKISPDQVYQLAGTLANDYDTDYKGNVIITKNIFDSILKAGLRVRTLIIGSCAEYGAVPESDNPVKEDYPLDPVSIYGLTKAYQTHLMKFYTSVYKMDIVMARTFNLSGRGMSNKLFIGRLYEEIDRYKKGKISKIMLGNLENKRDYIDVEEAVKRYEIIMNYGVSGEIYNVGSGRSIKIRGLLQNILRENGLSFDCVETRIVTSPNKIDINDICADISKLGGVGR